MQLKEIKKNFFSFEKERKVFECEIDFFHPWEYIRFDVFNEILIKRGLYSLPHDKNRKGNRFYAKKITNLIKNILTYNPYKNKNKNILFIGHSR
ncbi:hypothetical protein J7L48_01475, partial [bacterium]|nr:hypothetical protein [bacterium]